jgi:hypothetical protein
LKDSRDKAGENDKSPSVPQPAAVSADVATHGSGGGDEKIPASAQSAAAAGAKNDPKIGSDAGEPAAAEANTDTAARTETKDRNAQDRDGSQVLAKPSATSSASAASKNERVSKPEDGRVRKTVPNTMAVRSAKTARRGHQFRGGADGRSWKAVDAVPVWAGPPQTFYGSGVGARVPYVAAPADATKRQDWMSSAMTGTWERVVDAPAVVLDGGKHALYGILDSLW